MSKVLGGKSGKLKCTRCGGLRYPQVDLCPTCYYNPSRWKWYGINGFWEAVTRSDGDTDVVGEALVKTKATSLSHALSRFKSDGGFLCYEEYIESCNEKEVDEWLFKINKTGREVVVKL